MKIDVVLGCVALAVAGIGAAHAQTAACGQLAQLMTNSHAQVKALQGSLIEDGKEATEYKAKLQLAGFKDCTIKLAKAVDEFTDYWESQYHCDGEAASSDAANQVVESLWACTKETYSERHAGEAWIGGRYRVISFEGEAPTAGRSAGLVDFGETDYARVVLEKTFDTSDEYRLNIYWQFTQ